MTTVAAALLAVFVAAPGTSAAAAQSKKLTRGEKLAKALPAPLKGYTARERVEDNIKTKQVRVQRVYLLDKKPVLSIIVRSETAKTLKRRKAIFLDEKVVKAKKGEFKTISGQRFSILKIKGDYTAMTIVRETYSVLFFGTKDKTMLLAHIISTDFSKIAAVR